MTSLFRAALAAALALMLTAAAVPAGAVPAGAAVGFENPESMVWDAVTGAWYVSNFGGYTFDSSPDGNGFIARLRPGDVTPTVWATGLDAPQGIIIEGRTMYAADLDHVRIIDMADPASQSSIEIPGASLGDLDIDPATGDIYAGELSAGKIWRIRGGVPEEFVRLGSPDGLYMHEGALYVATFGAGIVRIDLGTREITTDAALPGTFLDGLERDGDAWLTTDFIRGQLLRVAGGTSTVVAQLAPSTADLGWDPATRTAGVPLLLGHTAVFWTV